MNINLNNLFNYSMEELSITVSNLASSIKRDLDFRVEQFCLVAIDQTRNNRNNPPALDVQDACRMVMKAALENKELRSGHWPPDVSENFDFWKNIGTEEDWQNLGKRRKLDGNLKTIYKFVNDRPIDDLVQNLSVEILFEVLSYLDKYDLKVIRTVDKTWNDAALYNLSRWKEPAKKQENAALIIRSGRSAIPEDAVIV